MSTNATTANPDAATLMQWDRDYVMGTYARQPVQFVRGRGARLWDSDGKEYLDLLAGGELVCAHGYSSDVQLAKKRNPALDFTIPAAGGFRWIDSLCIPVSAPNPTGANLFVEFYLTPEISALNSVAAQVDTGNEAAVQFVPAEVRDNPAIYPPQDVLARLRFIEDVGEAEELYQQAWRRVLSS